MNESANHFNFTVVDRLLFFWAAAPEEELTRGDIVEKMRANNKTVQAALTELQDRGVLITKPGKHTGDVGGSAARLYFLSPEARAFLTAPLAPQLKPVNY